VSRKRNDVVKYPNKYKPEDLGDSCSPKRFVVVEFELLCRKRKENPRRRVEYPLD
jgi:hypothetical protein